MNTLEQMKEDAAQMNEKISALLNEFHARYKNRDFRLTTKTMRVSATGPELLVGHTIEIIF